MTDRGTPTTTAEASQFSGLRRITAGDTLPAGVATLLAMEIRNRKQREASADNSGISGQSGPGIGEPRPIGPQRYVEPTPIFISPGEVRI